MCLRGGLRYGASRSRAAREREARVAGIVARKYSLQIERIRRRPVAQLQLEDVPCAVCERASIADRSEFHCGKVWISATRGGLRNRVRELRCACAIGALVRAGQRGSNSSESAVTERNVGWTSVRGGTVVGDVPAKRRNASGGILARRDRLEADAFAADGAAIVGYWIRTGAQRRSNVTRGGAPRGSDFHAVMPANTELIDVVIL